MTRWIAAAALAGSIAAGSLTMGCADMTPSQQRALSGGAIGAATGAAIGGIAGGHAGMGAAIGGATGATGGYLYEKTRPSTDDKEWWRR